MNARSTACIITALLVLAHTATPAGDQAAQPTDEPLMKITVGALEGDVEVKHAKDKDWVPAKVGMELGQGAELQTHLFSWVELKLANNTVTRLDSVTRVRVDQYLKDAEAVRTRLRLRSGALSAVVNKGKLKSDFRVSSPQSTASVRGSELTRFSTTPWIDRFQIGHGLFNLTADQLARTSLAQKGQMCAVMTDRMLGTLETLAIYQSPNMIPAFSTGQEIRRAVATRRFGDVFPSDADDGAGGIPAIPQVSAPPPPSSYSPAPTRELPSLSRTPEPPREYPLGGWPPRGTGGSD